MTLFFGTLDLLLTIILLFDTLGLAYQFRTKNTCDDKEYLRVCLSWILFLSISNLFSCEARGFFGTVFRLIIFLSKLFVVIPILGGTIKVYQFLVEERRAEKWLELIKVKVSKDNAPSTSPSTEASSRGETISE